MYTPAPDVQEDQGAQAQPPAVRGEAAGRGRCLAGGAGRGGLGRRVGRRAAGARVGRASCPADKLLAPAPASDAMPSLPLCIALGAARAGPRPPLHSCRPPPRPAPIALAPATHATLAHALTTPHLPLLPCPGNAHAPARPPPRVAPVCVQPGPPDPPPPIPTPPSPPPAAPLFGDGNPNDNGTGNCSPRSSRSTTRSRPPWPRTLRPPRTTSPPRRTGWPATGRGS